MREELPSGEAKESQTRDRPPSCLFHPPERACALNARHLGPPSLVEDLDLEIARGPSVHRASARDLCMDPNRTDRGQARTAAGPNRVHASVAV